MVALSIFLFICAVQKNYIERIILSVLILASRIPFLYQGYGSEDDSWGLIVNARLMHETGIYSYSRLPGHAFQEYLLSLIPFSSVFISNLVTALFSLVAVNTLYSILEQFQVKLKFSWSLTFALIPIIWITSTYTIDYMLALAFLIASLNCTLKKQVVWAGVLVGLAIGCRLTSSLYIPGILLILIPHREHILKFLGGVILTGIICYLPSFIVYGVEFLDAYRLPYPSAIKVIYKASIGVLGLTGSFALLLGIFMLRKNIRLKLFFENKMLQASIITILLYLASYLVIPQKSAFLIPLIPILILMFALGLENVKYSRIIQVLLILSSLTGGVDWTDQARGAKASEISVKLKIGQQEIFLDALNGPLLTEHNRRKNRDNYVNELQHYYSTIDENAVLLCGWWYNRVVVMIEQNNKNPYVILRSYADTDELDFFQSKGITIYHLREIDEANDERYEMENTKKISRLLY